MKFLLSLMAMFAVASCGDGSDLLSHQGECDGYVKSSDSPYKLPYQVGTEHEVSQANCGPVSHFGAQRYSYDFSMPIGTQVLAARAGKVIEFVENFEDGNGCPDDNHIAIEHDDGTVAYYVHLTRNGSDVSEGATVTQGQTIGRSGNTGCSAGAHLHFVVATGKEITNSVPVTFSNTKAHRWSLRQGTTYLAE